MANRFKNTEYSNEHNEKRKSEKWQTILNYKKDLQEQIAEKLEMLKKEELKNEEIVKEDREKVEAIDKKFFGYADHVKEMIKSRGGRTTIPLEKVIEVSNTFRVVFYIFIL